MYLAENILKGECVLLYALYCEGSFDVHVCHHGCHVSKFDGSTTKNTQKHQKL
jgi:hypothetical protein